MAVTTFFFSYGTRPTQYLLFHGRRFLFLQSLLIGALPAASSATGEKLLSQSCILFHKTGCPCCITDSLQKSSATMRINIEVAACVVIAWSKKSKSRTVSLGDLMHQELLQFIHGDVLCLIPKGTFTCKVRFNFFHSSSVQPGRKGTKNRCRNVCTSAADMYPRFT